MTVSNVEPDTGADAAKRASGSSFYHAMRILPPAQRQAMFEIYSFCRAVDDIADDPGDRDKRRAQLQQWRRDIDAVYGGHAPANLRGLAQAVGAFDLAREDFLAVVDGMEMDVEADIRAPDLATLDLYCDRVASAVGRLSVKVFGLDAKNGHDLAHYLGRALQLTNILRDLDEDAGMGRLYLPREALRDAGIPGSEPAAVLAHPALGQACAPILARAQDHFARADEIMRAAPRRAVRAPRIMGEAYKGYLSALMARGFAPPRERVRIGRVRLLWIILRHAVI
ncbi:MAG TPA: presqualene diphosphate synthase HpnD [Xanthobacteraceae bacterium]